MSKPKLPIDKSTQKSRPAPNMTVGDIASDNGSASKDVKRDGVKTRGNGAATKGLIARGPL